MPQLAYGKKLEPLAESVRRLVLRYKKHIKTILTTTLNLPHTSSLQSLWERSSISPLLMPHSKDDLNLFFYFLIIYHTQLTLLYDANI